MKSGEKDVPDLAACSASKKCAKDGKEKFLIDCCIDVNATVLALTV